MNLGFGKKGGKQTCPFDWNKEYTGIVKSYNQAKGYGFIDCEEIKFLTGRDVWLGSDEVDRFQIEAYFSFL